MLVYLRTGSLPDLVAQGTEGIESRPTKRHTRVGFADTFTVSSDPANEARTRYLSADGGYASSPQPTSPPSTKPSPPPEAGPLPGRHPLRGPPRRELPEAPPSPPTNPSRSPGRRNMPRSCRQACGTPTKPFQTRSAWIPSPSSPPSLGYSPPRRNPPPSPPATGNRSPRPSATSLRG